MGKRRKRSDKPSKVDQIKEHLGLGQMPYEGPTAADLTKSTRITHDALAEEIATQYEETVAYEDPYRSLPDSMDGVVQFKTIGEVAAEVGYLKALEDPLSVLGPRVTGDRMTEEDKAVIRDNRMARARVTRAHDPSRVDRAREGMAIEPFNQVPEDDD